MKVEILFILIQCAIFNNQYNFSKALVGPNVRSAEENEFPFVVSINHIYNSTNIVREPYHECTGTLVSSQDILTSEHCLRNILPTAYEVMIGSINLNLSLPYYPLFCLTYEYWCINRRVQMEYPYDLTFIKIIRDVPDYIPFAPLGYSPSNALYGLDVVTAGWGLIENHTLPTILQAVSLKILTKIECENKVLENTDESYILLERRLCTFGDPYAQLNYGDSGGPLLFCGSLIAVNSGVTPCHDGVIRPYQGDSVSPILFFGTLIAINCGVSPCYAKVIRPYQVNIHLNIYWYRQYIEDAIGSFHMNY